jgi:hypothetical protein
MNTKYFSTTILAWRSSQNSLMNCKHHNSHIFLPLMFLGLELVLYLPEDYSA